MDARVARHDGRRSPSRGRAGSIPITFADFGVTAPSLGFVSVEDHGEVEFLLNLAQA
nr:hypothetical protein [Pseudoclavibacter soli]